MEEEKKKALRVVDANFNRLREALRVVEDIARFVLNRGDISSLLKDMRMRLTQRGEEYFNSLSVRDTNGDVGTVLEGEFEMARDSVMDIAVANFKRAEESLRVLEEFYKLWDTKMARLFKEFRYKLYSVEKNFLFLLGEKHGTQKD